MRSLPHSPINWPRAPRLGPYAPFVILLSPQKLPAARHYSPARIWYSHWSVWIAYRNDVTVFERTTKNACACSNKRVPLPPPPPLPGSSWFFILSSPRYLSFFLQRIPVLLPTYLVTVFYSYENFSGSFPSFFVFEFFFHFSCDWILFCFLVPGYTVSR